MAVSERLTELPARLRSLWGAFHFRRHLPWLLLVLGLVFWAFDAQGRSNALFWIGGLVLAMRGLRWVWDRLLFRVSRRLWMILLLMSVLPVLTLGLLLLSFSWLGLGAQVSRSTQQTLTAWEEALRLANAAPTDPAAVDMLRTYGGAWVQRASTLPAGVSDGFVGIVWTDLPDQAPGQGKKDTYLRAVRKVPGGYRLLTLSLGLLGDRAQSLSGGQVSFRLAPQRLTDGVEESIRIQVGGKTQAQAPILAGQEETLAQWTMGQPLQGSGLNRPFSLPPLAFTIRDWATGRALVLSATPQTNLYALFAGYRSAERQVVSEGAVTAMVVVVVVLSVLMLAQAGATLLGLRLAWSLGRAVNALHGGVRRLTLGDFTTRIAPRGRDQVAQLSTAFNDMAERLQTANAEREDRLRMEEELRVAREVQMRLLPNLESLHMPSVRAIILPAWEVAGDYYDVFPLLDGGLAFLIADVSGKGTSAAFYAAETKGVLSALDKQALDPLEVADRLNAIWCGGHGRSLFLTLIYGTFHPRTGNFRFVRAGHPSAYLRRGSGEVVRLHPLGMGVGLSASRFRGALELCEGTLEPGDSLHFFTDGLSEAQAPDDSFYGEERLATLLGGPSEDLQTAILADVAVFTQGRPLADDLTLLSLSR